MTDETFEWAQSDGVPLHVSHWAPPSEPKAVLQILHGLAEHGARYAATAAALNKAGYAVYAQDHRGHGQSIQSSDDKGFWGPKDSFDRVVEDAHGVNRQIAERHPDLPIALLGHSGGSFMALGYLGRHPRTIAALALSGSNGPVGLKGKAGRQVAKLERLRLGPRGRSALLNKLSFGHFNDAFKPNRTEFDWLTRDDGLVDRYIADPLCGFVCTTQLWVDLLGAFGRIYRRDHLGNVPRELPIYVFAGALDPVGESTKGLQRLLKRFDEVGFTAVAHRFYPEARHEILNETNRDEVCRHLIEWLDDALFS